MPPLQYWKYHFGVEIAVPGTEVPLKHVNLYLG